MPQSTYLLQTTDYKKRLSFSAVGVDVIVRVPQNTGGFSLGWHTFLHAENVNSITVEPANNNVSIMVDNPTITRTDDIVYLINEDGVNTWKFIPFVRQPTITSERRVINSDLQLDSSDSIYQGIFPSIADLNVILPNPPALNDYFIIKNISTLFRLGIKESSTGAVITTLEPRGIITGYRFKKFLYDGVEWTEI